MAQAELHQQMQEKGKAAATSVAAAIFLTTLKLVVGLMTGSLGILAEAAHSALDLVAALITLFAVRVSDRPADQDHLYGHGKVENLSALAETILLFVTCGWIIYEAFNRLFSASVEVNPNIWAFLTMGISIATDFSRSRVLARAAKKYHSQALEADALHFSTDIWSSSVVIVGLALVWFGEAIGMQALFIRADAISALVVALIVIYVSWQLGRRTVDALLDRAPRGMADQIITAVEQVAQVKSVRRARVRGSGNQVFVDLQIVVPRHLSFEESHAVTRQVQTVIRSIAPSADVVVNPIPSADDEGIFEKIQATAERGHFDVHNITTHLTKRGIWIDLDLEVPPDVSFEQAHALATDLETQLRAEFVKAKPENPNAADPAVRQVADVNVHIEPRAHELATGAELPPAERARLVERIAATRAAIPHAQACQDIDLQKLNGSIYLALHLLIDSDLSIANVHSIAEEMENRLRREFPNLGRVVIHTEPYRKNK